jgi:hypothetical protein
MIATDFCELVLFEAASEYLGIEDIQRDYYGALTRTWHRSYGADPNVLGRTVRLLSCIRILLAE